MDIEPSWCHQPLIFLLLLIRINHNSVVAEHLMSSEHTIFCIFFLVGFLPEASFGIRVLSLPPCVRQSWACLRDNSSQVRAWITKFGPKNAKYFAQGPNCFGDWLGLTFQVKFCFIEKFCLFASLLHLWNICETCQPVPHLTSLHTLSDYYMPTDRVTS